MRRKEAKTNEDDLKAKKEIKAAKEAQRRKEMQMRANLWKYGPYALSGIVVIVLIISITSISRATIKTLDLTNKDQLKKVLLGGDPWLVACANDAVPVHPSFSTAAQKLTATTDIQFAALDCAGKLPSNKTFFQRFKFPPTNFSATAPLAYLCANGDVPIQVPNKYVAETSKLIEWAEKYSKPSVKECSWDKTFKHYCLDRDACVMLHTKGKTKAPKWLPKLMAAHRTVKFLSINRKRHQTSFDADVRMSRKEEIPRVAVLQRKKNADGDHSYQVTPHRGEWTESDVRSFVNQMLKPGAAHKDSVALEEKPWFDKPPADKKRGARARAANKAHRERQRTDGSSGSSKSSSEAGSDEGAGGRRKTKQEEADEAEKARKEAVRRAEEQLSDDDDVVVSDIEEEEEDDV